MKLEVGKYYKTRDGRKVGPMVETSLHDYRFTTDRENWYLVNGIHAFDDGNIDVNADIIAEWTDTPAPVTLSHETIDHIAIDSLKWHYATEMQPLEKEAFRIILRYYGVTL